MIFARGSSPLIFNVSCWFCGAHRFTLCSCISFNILISYLHRSIQWIIIIILNFNRLACVQASFVKCNTNAFTGDPYEPFSTICDGRSFFKIPRAISNAENEGEGLVEPHSRIAKQKQNKRNIRFRIFSAGTLKYRILAIVHFHCAVYTFSVRAGKRSLEGAEAPAAIRSTLNFDYVISIWM